MRREIKIWLPAAGPPKPALANRAPGRIEFPPGRLIEEFSAATARSRTGTAKLDFTASDRKTKRLIEAEGIGKTLGGRRLFRESESRSFSRGVRIRTGRRQRRREKTTLLKLLEGKPFQPDEGTIQRADQIRIVEFRAGQEARILDHDASLRRTLCPEGDMVIYRDRPDPAHVAGWAR